MFGYQAIIQKKTRLVTSTQQGR